MPFYKSAGRDPEPAGDFASLGFKRAVEGKPCLPSGIEVMLPERKPRPVWIIPQRHSLRDCWMYYRAAMPARMVSGSVENELWVSRDGERARPLDLYDLHEDPIKGAQKIQIYGLGSPTIILANGVNSLSYPDATAWATRLVALANGAGADIRLDLDDNFRSPEQYKAYVAEGAPSCRDRWLLDVVREGKYADWTVGKLTKFWDEAGLLIAERVLLDEFFPQCLRGYDDLLRSASRYIASNERMRSALAGFLDDGSSRIAVARNAFDPQDFAFYGPRRVQDGKVRLGYSGTSRNHEAFKDHAFRVLSAAAKLPNVELHFWGWHPLCRSMPRCASPGLYAWEGHKYILHETDFDLPRFQAGLGILDVAIAPLLANDFNVCRSGQKWYEHSCHATPMVVSDVGVYDGIEHGVSGFKAADVEEFISYVRRLCMDGELRQRVGHNALEAVLANYSTDHLAAEWRESVR